jgi:hypothetical protein
MLNGDMLSVVSLNVASHSVVVVPLANISQEKRIKDKQSCLFVTMSMGQKAFLRINV